MSSPQSPQDSYALWQARIAANLPQLSLADQMVGVGLAQSFLSDNQDIRQNLVASAVNISVLTASGSGLDALGANVGVKRQPATPSVVSLQFSRANPGDTSTTITIPAGTVVSTTADGITTQPVGFATNADAIISSGSVGPVSVLATATTPGTVGNVAINSVTVPVIATGTSVAWAVTNPGQGAGSAFGYTTAGSDGQAAPDGDPSYLASIQANTVPIYSSAAVIAAIKSVAGVFDAATADPQDGLGGFTYYWAQADGTTPGLSGSTITAGTLAQTVDNAVRAVLPPNILPTANAFTIVNLTAIAVSFSAGANVSTSTVTPQIQTAIANYVQGLAHGVTPTIFGMINAVNTATGYTVSNLTLTSSTPSITTAGSTTLYRCTGTPSSVVSVTRV